MKNEWTKVQLENYNWIDYKLSFYTLNLKGSVLLYREWLCPVEGHPSTTLLRAPLTLLLIVPDHRVFVKPRIEMQSNSRAMAQVHVKPDSQRTRNECIQHNSRVGQVKGQFKRASTFLGLPRWM